MNNLKMFFSTSLFLMWTATNVFASYPFTISGDKVAAIFKSPKISNKVGGPFQSIIYRGHSQEKRTSHFAVTTTEMIDIVNASGVTTGTKAAPCLLLVDVTDKGDGMRTDWEVTDVDFTACPLTTLK